MEPPARTGAGRSIISALRRTVVHATHVARNAALDLRYGAPLASAKNSDHQALAQVFAGRIDVGDVLVDIGCGKGRVINWWLRNTADNRIVGLELDPKTAQSTARRLRRHNRVHVIEGDAVETLPTDGTVFYLFNPGGPAFVEPLEERLRSISTLRTVLYYNPKHLSVFIESGHWEVSHVRLDGRDGAPYSDLAVLTPR